MSADHDLSPAAEARLRTALDAAATGEPVAPAWDAIRERMEAGEGVRRPHRTPRLLALAAAVLVVVAVAAAVVAGTRDDGSTVVTDTTEAPEPEATGWYVPVDLPAGWVVEGVTARRGVLVPCPDELAGRTGRAVTWVDRTRRARIFVANDPCATPATALGLPPEAEVDLGGGITASVLPLPGSQEQAGIARWTTGDRTWTVNGAGVGRDEVIEVARAAAAAEDPTSVVPAGFAEAERWEVPSEPPVEVVVTLAAPSGTRLHYRLEPPGQGVGHGSTDPEPFSVPGQDLPVERMWNGDDSRWWAMRAAGFWPGADVAVMLLDPEGSTVGSAEDQAADADVATLLAHLRPADTATWRAFLADVEHTPVLAEAAAFADLAALDVPPPGAPSAADGADTTTTTGGTTGSTQPG